MARSPLTLAAAATAALAPVGSVEEGIRIVGAATLSENTGGRYDSALLHLDDGDRAVVRVPTTAEADAELDRETTALTALTPGVRALIGFAAPQLRGRARLSGGIARVFTYLDGYRVDAAHVPAGRGVATALAEAIASVHDLPSSVVTGAGLPSRTSAQIHGDTERLLDRAEATGRLPFGLLRRWSRALTAEGLWRFEPTVTLGGVDPASFTLVDVDGVPTISGLLTWGGLSVGDPAEDLRWTSGSPDASADVFATYSAQSHRSPDAMIAERARLHAELEFAKWLVHGHETGSESIMADAVALLTALADTVSDDAPIAAAHVTVDDAIAALGRVPAAQTDAVDTSMQTDAYDPGEMGLFDEDDDQPSEPTTREPASDAGSSRSAAADLETEPLEFSEWPPSDPATGGSSAAHTDAPDDDRDPDDAARNALRRWTGTA
ncbi:MULTISPECIES: phosphotransferase [unclassified Microbacterium]|uniref:phosphotransferase n=1 Tax=unclassified Microbacterium TaxID=2609290 RepID=UPI0038643E08